MNLNDAVESNCKDDFKNLDVIMELSPEIQREYDEDLWSALYVGIGNLTLETRQYRKGKIKVVTRVKDSQEILEIYSEGEQLPKHMINYLNRQYRAGRQLTEKPKISGSRIAAFLLAKVNGVISIENYDLPPYTLRNSVVFE